MSIGQSLQRSLLRFLLLTACLQSFNTVSTTTNEPEYFNVIEKLQAKLLPNYNKKIRPVANHKDTVDVDVQLTLTTFQFDEQLSRFSAAGYFYMKWIDPRLTWSPSDYDGLEVIRIPSSEVWKPDLEMYNSPGLTSDDRTFAKIDMVVTYNGTIIYVPICNLVSACIPEPSMYPFDTVKCTTMMGSWAHNAQQITMKIRDGVAKVDTSALASSKNLNWKLLDTNVMLETKVYDCCPEPYQNIQISYIMERSLSTSTSIISATIAIVILTLVTVFIPAAAGAARLVVATINLMLLCAGLFYFHAILPSGSIDQTPLIVMFYSGSLIPVILSIIISIVSLRWANSSGSSSTVRKCLNSRVGRILGVSRETDEDVLGKDIFTEKSELFGKRP